MISDYAENMDIVDCFDGIWACASLLHIPKNQMCSTLKKITNVLKDEGILCSSIKKERWNESVEEECIQIIL